MTITTNDARDEYTSGAGQTVFNYTFKIFADDELDVYVTPAGQEANDSTDLTTDYVVDSGTIGNEAGGFITFNTPLSSGDLVTITSGIPYDRTTDYQFNGDFNPTTVNNDNDRQTAQIKQVLELARKAVVFGQAQQGTSGLTSEAPEAGKFIRWKDDLSGFENTDLQDLDAITISNVDVIYPTVALMKADALNVLEVGSRVSTQGYYTSGDGGGATYLVVAPQAVDGFTSFLLANGNAAVLQAGAGINVKQAGAVGDGVTDDTAAIQAAISALSDSGGTIFVPKGIYVLSSTLTAEFSDLTIRGEGRNTILTHNGDYGETIDISDSGGTSIIERVVISDLSMNVNGVTTSGAQLKLDAVVNFSVSNVHINNGHTGILCDGCDQGNFSDVYVLFNSTNGGDTTGKTYLQIGSTSNTGKDAHGGDLFFSNCNFRGGSQSLCDNGILIDSGDGYFFDNCHIGNTDNFNLIINANSSVKCTGMLFNNCWFDISDGVGIQISGNTPSINGDFYFSDCKVLGAGTGSHGVVLDGSDAERIHFNNCKIQEYTLRGVDIRSSFTGDLTIDGCSVLDNSLSGAGAQNGINYISTAPARIVNCKVSGANHAAGIFLSGNKDNATIDNNDVTGNISPMTELSGTSVSQKDNKGFNPNGDRSEVLGSSPYTFTNNRGFNVEVIIAGGTVSGIQRNGANLPSVTSGQFVLGPDDSVTITYSSAPTFEVYGL